MEIIAFYLPQFHTIPENDGWWGEGFTEWTNVRKAKPLYSDQVQPREPYDDFYYDLSNVETIRWQAKLAHRFNVYGFCFYHYWFDGKLLLQKPCELLLANPDIDIHYCMSWANEPWARTWDGKNNEVLMPQRYGEEKEWKIHFEYLLKFFKDNRYIKEDNKPMFLIYKSDSISQCKKMMKYWEELSIKNGFAGIYFVETLRLGSNSNSALPFSAHVEFEPARTLNNLNFFHKNYNRIRRRIVKLINFRFHTNLHLNKRLRFKDVYEKSLKNLSNENTFGGVFTGWDNTPRRGEASIIVTEASEEEFSDYIKRKIEITKNTYHTKYLFINAWNEWCEGTYLEPDKHNGYKYLNIIKKVLEQTKTF